MSQNMQILNAQSDVHNLQCLISLLKKMLTSPESEITLNEYELEGMLDQLDDAFERLEVLSQKLETLKQQDHDFSVLKDAEKVIAILAKTRATHKKHRVSMNSCKGNGNGNGNGKLQEIPNLRA